MVLEDLVRVRVDLPGSLVWCVIDSKVERMQLVKLLTSWPGSKREQEEGIISQDPTQHYAPNDLKTSLLELAPKVPPPHKRTTLNAKIFFIF